MMKRLSLLAVGTLLALSLGSAVPALASDDYSAGIQLFKSKCASCHSLGQSAHQVYPISKTTFQWKRFFKKKSHSTAVQIWDQFSDEEIALISQALIHHAADSENPMRF